MLALTPEGVSEHILGKDKSRIKRKKHKASWFAFPLVLSFCLFYTANRTIFIQSI